MIARQDPRRARQTSCSPSTAVVSVLTSLRYERDVTRHDRGVSRLSRAHKTGGFPEQAAQGFFSPADLPPFKRNIYERTMLPRAVLFRTSSA